MKKIDKQITLYNMKSKMLWMKENCGVSFYIDVDDFLSTNIYKWKIEFAPFNESGQSVNGLYIRLTNKYNQYWSLGVCGYANN